MVNLDLHLCWTSSEKGFPLPSGIERLYGPFGFPEPPGHRPYITSNFVMALDGRSSFRELRGRAGGNEVSRSKEDRWLMAFLRAHHDAHIIGAGTIRTEAEENGRGWDYGIRDSELMEYRMNKLRLGLPKVMILTASGNVDLRLKVLNSEAVEPWIITTRAGADALAAQAKAAGAATAPKIIVAGAGNRLDLPAVMRLLRSEYGIKRLLCEGGPELYGQFLEAGLIDEDFRTISLQVLGKSADPQVERPTAYGNVSFLPETAPWFTLISVHASPYHLFLRLRYKGPRKFDP